MGSSLHGTRTRVPSQYLRELTLGKFIVKHEDITLLDCIGEGTFVLQAQSHYYNPFAGEFGVVYKARLSFQGRRSKEVAVKTLKGFFLPV